MGTFFLLVFGVAIFFIIRTAMRRSRGMHSESRSDDGFNLEISINGSNWEELDQFELEHLESAFYHF